jgi:hypothetical protein
MQYRARPTLRCLFQDLRTSLEDSGQRSAIAAQSIEDLGPIDLDDIAHPLLRKASELADRSQTELHSQQIKSVSNGVFYKAKVERWRGAVWLDDSGRPWLCSAGIRREGEHDDFYEQFAKECASDLEGILPLQADRMRLRKNRVRAADELRLRLLRLRVVGALLTALDEQREVTVSLPVTIDQVSFQPVEGSSLVVELLADDNQSNGSLVEL